MKQIYSKFKNSDSINNLLLHSSPSLLNKLKKIKNILYQPYLFKSLPLYTKLYKIILKKQSQPLLLAFTGKNNLEEYFCNTGQLNYLGSILARDIEQYRLPDIWFNTSSTLCIPAENYEIFSSYTWVRQVLDIQHLVNGLPAQLSKGLVKRDLKRLDKSDYQVKRAKNLFFLKLFYYKIYKPHIQKRFHRLAHLSSIQELAINTAFGEVLLCFKNNKLWSGGILCYFGDTLSVPWLGVVDGNPDIIKEGGLKAVYYEALKLAIKRRFNKMDFSNSRPFLNNGVYKHKKRWGCVAKKPITGVTPLKVGVHFSNKDVYKFFNIFPIIIF